MRVDEFITYLRNDKNIVISVENGQLSIAASKKALTSEVIQEIKNKKEEILLFFKKAKNGKTDIPKIGKETYYQLSYAQRRLWVLDQLVEKNGVYNVPMHREFSDLDTEALKKALNTLIERHEILRTTIHVVEGEPKQKIQSLDAFSFRVDHYYKKNNEVQNFIEKETYKPFDLSERSIRAVIVEKEDSSIVFLLVMHHIITDGWSANVIQKELMALYEGFATGKQLKLPLLKIQYKEYAYWQHQQLKLGEFKESQNYWFKKLKENLPKLKLPLDNKRRDTKSYQGTSVRFQIKPEKVQGLESIGNSCSASLFMVLTSVLNVLFYKYTNQTDIVFGSPVSGRNHPDLQNQIGYYSNTIVFRSIFNSKSTFQELLKKVSKEMLEGYEHQYYPFDLLVDDLELSREMNRNPLFDVMISYNDINDFGNEKELKGLPSKIEIVEDIVNKFDLSYSFVKSEKGALYVDINFDNTIFSNEKVVKMAGHINTLISEIIKNPNQKINELNLLTEDEKELLFQNYNKDNEKNNFSLNKYIIDENNQLLPIGIKGEVALSGKLNEIKVYLNVDEIDEDRWGDLFGSLGTKIYKTGIIGLWNEFGELIIEKDNLNCNKVEEVLRKEENIKDVLVIKKEENKSLEVHYIEQVKEENSEEIQEGQKNSIGEVYIENSPSFPNRALFIDELLDKTVAENKSRVALVVGSKRVTYGVLNDKINALALKLQQDYAIGVGDKIGILTSRSEKMIEAILSVLKLGATYVPLDIDYPEDRITYMVNDASVKLLITDEAILIPDSLQNIECLVNKTIDSNGKLEIKEKRAMSDLAYVCYTSGSTGTPKGVMISHESLVDYIETFNNYFQVSKKDIVIQQSSISFDTAVEEIFPILIKGGTLVLLPKGGRDIDGIIQAINRWKVTILSTTPLVINELNSRVDELNSYPRILISGGDKLQQSHINHIKSHTTVYNTYGPTETTVCATFGKVSANASNIGKPIANHAIYIVDENEKKQAVGVVGEIYIAGPGVAKGYINKEKETLEQFVKNPFGVGKCYKTGDLARWNEDGTIEFIGRKDSQIKVRGYRVELDEVNLAIESCKKIKQSVTLVYKDAYGNNTIVSYYIVQENVKESELRFEIKEKLPHYMLPSYFIQVEGFPKTINGKINVEKLPKPEVFLQNKVLELKLENILKKEFPNLKTPLLFFKHSSFVYKENGLIDRKKIISKEKIKSKIKPINETEEKLLNIWSKFLKNTEIGVEDDFFEIGGNSIRATQIIGGVYKELLVNVTLKDVFNNPTIKTLSNFILNERKDASLLIKFNKIEEGKTNLFFIPPILGSSTIFNGVASRLSNCYNVYGFQYKGFDEDVVFENSIEKMARTFTSELKNIQKSKQIQLVAFSMGVPIAFEMAKLLEKEYQVSLIFIDRGVKDEVLLMKDEFEMNKLLNEVLHFWFKEMSEEKVNRVKRLITHNLSLLEKYEVIGEVQSDVIAIEATENETLADMKHWQKHTRGTFLQSFIKTSHYEIFGTEYEEELYKKITQLTKLQITEY